MGEKENIFVRIWWGLTWILWREKQFLRKQREETLQLVCRIDAQNHSHWEEGVNGYISKTQVEDLIWLLG